MEEASSPATRLPEADSLPEGFVESSIDHSPPMDGTSRHSEADGSATDAFVDGLLSLSVSGNLRGSTLPEQNDNGAYSLPKTASSSVTGDVAGCSTDQRDNSEPKRKSAKRSTKSEKEMLELMLKYQKTIAERDAAVAVRERLESLCRELQRQNKMLAEECRRVSTEGQNMRQELSEKFNSAIKDISCKLETQKEDCLSQLRENEMLRNKLKELADQYTLTEQQFAQKLKEKMLEVELADLKLRQQQEISAQEQKKMQLQAEQVSQLMATEKSLRMQLAADGERFQQFQDALSKSNEIFETYKLEMEKMVKLIKELKKENEFLKNKSENSDVALVKLVEEREVMKKQIEKCTKQKEKLEALCRSLQAERKQQSTTTITAAVSSTTTSLGASPDETNRES